MTVYAATIVDLALTQAGGAYEWGGKAAATDPDPKARHGLDCSGLVAWAVRRAGGVIPDGSAQQWAWCRDHGTNMPVQAGEATRGALLFEGVTPVHHVVLSLGDGRTIEARGASYGIGVWPVANRPWTHAARVPNVAYEPTTPPPPPPAHPEGVGDAFVPGRMLRLQTPRLRGADVRQAQAALRTRGYALATDGVFGRITDRAVRHFQEHVGLKADGVVGPLTWRALLRTS